MRRAIHRHLQRGATCRPHLTAKIFVRRFLSAAKNF
jgi:hypothetical protein